MIQNRLAVDGAIRRGFAVEHNTDEHLCCRLRRHEPGVHPDGSSQRQRVPAPGLLDFRNPIPIAPNPCDISVHVGSPAAFLAASF